MINTYSESSLHKTLKTLYSLEDGCRTEVECDGKIYDIVDSSGGVIEIQTQNVSKLLDKVNTALENGRKIKIVHPVVLEKHIELYDSDGTKISRRKSPVKGSVYDMFGELTRVYPVLLHGSVSLEILEITMTEQRIRTGEPVQSPNGRRRFRKDWNKTDKILGTILRTRTFSSAEDYLSLIPPGCLPEFSAAELAAALRSDPSLPLSAAAAAHLMIWVLHRMDLLQIQEVKRRSRYYTVK